MVDIEYVVADPVLGDVSVEDETMGRFYADAWNGVLYAVTWQDGEIISREAI